METIHQGIGFTIVVDFPSATTASDVTIALRNPATNKSYTLTLASQDTDTLTATITGQATATMLVGNYNLEIYDATKSDMLYFEENYACVVPSSASAESDTTELVHVVVNKRDISKTVNATQEYIPDTQLVCTVQQGKQYTVISNGVIVTCTSSSSSQDDTSVLGAHIMLATDGDGISDGYLYREIGETFTATYDGSMYVVFSTKDYAQDIDSGGSSEAVSLDENYRIDINDLTVIEYE